MMKKFVAICFLVLGNDLEPVREMAGDLNGDGTPPEPSVNYRKG